MKKEYYYVDSTYISQFFTKINVVEEVGIDTINEFMKGLSITNTLSYPPSMRGSVPQSYVALVSNVLLISRGYEDMVYLLDEYVITDNNTISIPGGCVSDLDFKLHHPSELDSTIPGDVILQDSICRSLYEKTTRAGMDSYYARRLNVGPLTLGEEMKQMYRITPRIPNVFYYQLQTLPNHPEYEDDCVKRLLIIYVPAILDSMESVMLRSRSTSFIPITRSDCSFMDRHKKSTQTLKSYFRETLAERDIRIDSPESIISIFKSTIFNK